MRAVEPLPRSFVIAAWLCFLTAAVGGAASETLFAVGGITGGVLLLASLATGLASAADARVRGFLVVIVVLLAVIAIGGGIALLA